MSNFVIDPYTSFPAVSDILWNQDKDEADMFFNTYARCAMYYVNPGASMIGKTLKTFTMRMRSKVVSPADNPTVFGVWSKTNVTTTPTTSFSGTGALTNNTNQLSTSNVDYTFTGSHVLVAEDNIGFVPLNNTVDDYAVRRTNTTVAIDMKVSNYFITSPPTWNIGANSQLPFGYGSQV
tara:strand:- start:86 stop:622 length:537 start_codon:yes stop_codon:yes gene_type:complete